MYEYHVYVETSEGVEPSFTHLEERRLEPGNHLPHEDQLYKVSRTDFGVDPRLPYVAAAYVERVEP